MSTIEFLSLFATLWALLAAAAAVIFARAAGRHARAAAADTQRLDALILLDASLFCGDNGRWGVTTRDGLVADEPTARQALDTAVAKLHG